MNFFRFSVFTLSGHESMTQDQMDVLNSSTNSILLSSITLSEIRKVQSHVFNSVNLLEGIVLTNQI